MASTKEKKILITGAGGQLAQCLKKQLPTDIADEYLFVSREELDITDTKGIYELFKSFNPNVVINTAAYTQVDHAEDEPEKAFSINAEAVKTLAEACYKNDALLIHISTDYVFDGKANTPYHEDDATHPQTVYGASKRKGEEQLIASALKQFYIIRTSWLYSEFGHNFYKTMQRLSSEKEKLNVVNDQQGCPTNANDLARGILKIIAAYKSIHHKNSNYGIYHFSNAGNTTWYDFATAIFTLKKINIPVLPVPSQAFPTKAKRPCYSILRNEKFQETFHFQIPHWKESLENLIQSEPPLTN